MSINWKLIETQLDITFNHAKPSNETDAAISIANAYEAGILSATTLFQNTIISYNKPLLISSLSSAFVLARTTSKLNIKLIVNGFVGFWIGAMLSPLPMHPPTVSPSPILPPCIVTYPGDPTLLETALKTAFITFSGKTSNLTIQSIILALKSHVATISGVYNGMIVSPTGLIPSPPIPWVGIF